MKKAVIIFALLLPAVTGFAQGEGLMPLLLNEELNRAESKVAFRNNRSQHIQFIYDTLELPFVDDFSRNHIRPFNTNVTADDPEVMEVVTANFMVDSVYVDTISYMLDTTYTYQYNSQTQEFDTIPNEEFRIDYLSGTYPFNITETEYGWPPYSREIVGPNVTTNYFDEDSIDFTLINSIDTFLIVPDKEFYLWRGKNVFINRSYGIDPPTIGVATFDGVDFKGEPYNIGAANPYGIADTLQSKPIDLDGQSPGSQVYLSFYFQPQGHGDDPQEEDSLVLEFFAPHQGWKRVWSAMGSTVKDFEEVFIAVEDTMYLHKGFKFQFLNYATLNGNLDHWNLDYVYLDAGRSATSKYKKDLAIKEIEHSMIETYTSMPWNHYDPAFMKTHMELSLFNFTAGTLHSNNFYQVYESDDTLFSSGNKTIPDFPIFAENEVIFSLNSGSDPFSFVKDNEHQKEFRIRFNTESTTLGEDLIPENDTIYYHQIFKDYYAYDDGVVEKAYYLTGEGAELAYEFETVKQDTLRGIYMYHPRSVNDISTLSFNITVWQSIDTVADLNYTEEIIYRINFLPQYNQNFDGFVRYELDSLIILEAGTFYIGWENVTNDRMLIGFDENIENQDKIFYSTPQTNGLFLQTSFTGSLLMRPDFGHSGDIRINAENLQEIQDQIKIYPNPARDELNISIPHDQSSASIEMYDLAGKMVLSEKIDSSGKLNISHLKAGFYIVKIMSEESQKVERIVINR